ncbi:multidrug ABC transporter ATP-binding protein [Actinorhabdospora filicis]|uniref:Multidrug ABC transporter ATP-binding protein n=1 Tax=Actinorhabdospora filicis TaxID=1785913 RepID=A0A9W6SGL7_9ACTN|nr:multidrug ABC transporter ATP-binding protein [Actinorhabdospora filicis]
MLRHVLRGQRRRAVLGTVLASGHQIGEALVPVMVGVVIDKAIATGDVSALVLWLAVLAGVFACLSYSYRFYARVAVRGVEEAAHDLRTRIARQVLDPRGVAEDRLPGAVLRVATTDATGAARILRVIPAVASAFGALGVAVVTLMWTSVTLGILVVVGAIPVLALMQVLGRPLEKRLHAEQDAASASAGVAADLVSGLRVLKGVGAEAAAGDRYRRMSRASLTAAMRSARFEAGFQGVATLITGVFVAVVAVVAGRMAADRAISVGALIATVGLAQFLIGPLQNITAQSAAFAHARASARRVAETLSAPHRPEGEGDYGGARHDVVLDGLSAGPLKGLDLTVGHGELVGVAALDPADGAAVLGVLAGELAPDEGRALVGGRDLAGLRAAEARAAVLVAAHDADLFDESLLANVALRPGGPVEEAIAATATDDVIGALPDGRDTRVGEQGHALSGGQRQRVALARALASGAPVLALDEPTSAVDTVTEARIALGLREVREGRTTLLVTTSPTLLAACDRVVVLARGRVDAQGAHAELAANHEEYRMKVVG